MAELKYLVSFNCTAKVYYAVGSRNPVQHSCRFSLAIVNGAQPCFVMEGAGIGKPKKMKFSQSNLSTVVAPRIGEGKLSITARNQEWDTIALSDVKDTKALGHLHQLLTSISNGVFSKDMGGVSGHSQGSRAGKSPSPSSMVTQRSSVEHSQSAKKKRMCNLTFNSSNWRGASMVAAARSNSKTTPSERTSIFYGSKSPASGSSSLTPPSSFVKERSGNHSAKRMLLLGEGGQKSQEEEDFLPSPNYRTPLDSTPKTHRPPLGALSPTPQTNNVSHGQGRLEQLLRSEVDPDGFANLGNTCYMNAVLQSLLGLYPFAEDLQDPVLVKSVHPNSLYRMIVILLKCKRAKDSFESQKILLKKIKSVISANTPKFIGFRQQDAHELLSQCLDQLKEDVEHLGNEHSGVRNAESANSPVIVNFQSDIENRIVCKECGHVTQTSQVTYDFSLQLPKRVHHKHNEQANLQQLFDQFFADEEVEFNCTSCQCKRATLSPQLSRLPRILILHLKRYGYNYQLSENSKRVDNIRIPRYINVGHLTKSQCEPPPAFTAPNPRDRHNLSAVLGQSEEKENLPATGQQPTPLTQRPTTSTQQPTPLTQRPTTSTNQPLMQTPPFSQKPLQEVSDHSQVAVLRERNCDTHTTITSLTPPTTPAHSIVATTKENAIEIMDSDDEATYTVSHDGHMSTVSHDNHTSALSHDSHMSAVSHDGHMSMRDQSLTPSNEYIPGEHLAGSVGAHKVCVGEGGDTRTPRSSSLLGKRKRPVDSEHIQTDTGASRDSTDSEGPVKNSFTAKHGQGTGMASADVSTVTGQRDGGIESDGCACVCADSRVDSKSDTLSKVNSVVADSGTGMGTLEISELNSQEIRDRSLAEFDEIIANTSLEELTGFPIVALDNNAKEMTMTSNDSNRTEIPDSSVKKSPAEESGQAHFSEVKGDGRHDVDPERSVSPLFDQESEDLQRAVQESLRTQVGQGSDFQLEGLSEEEQLRLALELSIQDTLPTETTPTTSFYETTHTSWIQATPTPEKLPQETYRLVSIVNHIGRGSAGGHYISDVYSFPDHAWRTYNDEQVSEVREESVRQLRQTTGYIFFYLHRTTFTSISAQFGR